MNSRCPADAQHVQLGLVQTHVPQSQPGEHAGKNDEDWYETPEDDPLSLGEFVSFSVGVAGMTDVGVGSGCSGEYGGQD